MRGVKIPDFRPIHSERILGLIVSGLAFIFPVAVLVVNRADSTILLLLGSIGVYVLLRHGIRNLDMNRQELMLVLLFLGWYSVIVFCYFVGHETDVGFKLLGRNIRLLFFIPAFIACRRYLRDERLLWAGLALAPYCALIYGLLQYIGGHGDIRVGGAVEVIPFGDLSMAMGFMALASLYAAERPRKAWQHLLAGGALVSGIVTSVLSGTRGGWIAFPILFVVTIIVMSENSTKRSMKILLSFCAVVLLAVLASPRAIIMDRVDDAIASLVNYRGYLKLIETKDISRRGCLNDKLFLDNLARQIQGLHIRYLDAAVVSDKANLERSGFGDRCQSGYVIRVSDKNPNDNLMFRMQRIVSQPQGTQTVQFIARGEGRLTIIYGYDKDVDWTQINNKEYGVVGHTQNIKELAWPDFWIPAGGSLYFVPIQNSTGEYIFPFVSNSVGERLEMWRAAWHIFKEHPVAGAGTGSFLDEVADRLRSGDVFLQVISYDHPHNDYLNALSSQGMLGLVMYLLCMGGPLVLYSMALRSAVRYKNAAGFAGVIIVSGLLVFGITETMFTHSIVMSWYVTFTAMLMAVIFKRESTGTYDVEV